jgi:Fe-S cluster biogenesis protein NfuA
MHPVPGIKMDGGQVQISTVRNSEAVVVKHEFVEVRKRQLTVEWYVH